MPLVTRPASTRSRRLPLLDMREVHPIVRRIRHLLAVRPVPRCRILDQAIRSPEGDHDTPVRIFRPRSLRRRNVLVFLHGGGWVTGDIATYTPACVVMADLTGCVVASGNYRLAPSTPSLPVPMTVCGRCACCSTSPGAWGLRMRRTSC